MAKWRLRLSDGTTVEREADTEEQAMAAVQREIDAGNWQTPVEKRGFLKQTFEQTINSFGGLVDLLGSLSVGAGATQESGVFYDRYNPQNSGINGERAAEVSQQLLAARPVQKFFERMGATQAANPYAYGTGEGLATLPLGVLARMGGGARALSGLAKELAPTAGSAVGVGAAREMAPDSGLMEAAGGLVGGVAGGIPQTVGSAVRASIRGTDTAVYRTNLERLQREFGRDIRITPTPLAGESAAQRLRSLEQILAGSPGARAPFLSASKDVLNRFKTKLFNELDAQGLNASQLYNTDYKAGRLIQESILDSDTGWVSQFHQRYEILQQPLTKALTQKFTQAANTSNFLQQINPIRGAPNATVVRDSVDPQIANAIIGDLNRTGWVPYEALAAFRTDVGYKLNDAHLIGSKEMGWYKRLYEALTKDMQNVAEANNMGLRFSRLNDYYKAGTNRVQDFLDVINRKASPEQVLEWASSGSARDSSRLAVIRGSLRDPEKWEFVRKQIIRRMGTPTKARGISLDMDEAFDIVEWSKNYTQMSLKSPRGRNILFPGRSGDEFDKIADAVNRLRELKSPLVSPEMVGGRGLAASMLLGTTMAATSGAVAGAGGSTPYIIASGVGSMVAAIGLVNGSARLMTSPKFVRWLANGIDMKPGQLEGHMARLAIEMQDENDVGTLDALIDYVDSVDALEQARNPEGDQDFRAIQDLLDIGISPSQASRMR
jgi:hypothetical protein